MKIGIPREVHPDERRVAAAPATVERLRARGFEVLVEAGAGTAASFPDASYREAGAEVVEGARALWDRADLVFKVRPPEEHPGLGHEADLTHEGQVLFSLIHPGQNEELVDRLAARGATVFALDQIPRITRAQSMDVLSSMSNLAGYRAVIEASHQYGGFFAGQHTAAGSVPPAKVLVIGAGVAGLAAIAAARSLGAIVRAFDTRSATREEVESLGGEFLELDFEEQGEGAGGYAKEMSPAFLEAETALFQEQAAEVDIVITTALVPGRRAPVLWTEEMVRAMKPGSVIVDLAAEQGGNCALTVPGEATEVGGVSILGYGDLASRMAGVASEMWGTNLANFLELLISEGEPQLRVDYDDEIVRGALVLHRGEKRWPPPEPARSEAATEAAGAPGVGGPAPAAAGAAPFAAPPPPTAEGPDRGEPAPARRGLRAILPGIAVLALVAGWIYLRFTAGGDALSPAAATFLQHLTVFVLSCFVGWQVIWSVTPALHTPLMSVTNAISGIIIIGGILQGGGGADLTVPVVIGGVAVLFAAINIFGGFLVTQRMLRMFRK